MREVVHISDIIELLERIREKPFQFLTDTPFAIENYLRGMYYTLSYMGVEFVNYRYDELHKSVIIERGWEWSTAGPWREMKDKGMSNQDIAKEVLSIEIETWKKRMNS